MVRNLSALAHEFIFALGPSLRSVLRRFSENRFSSVIEKFLKRKTKKKVVDMFLINFAVRLKYITACHKTYKTKTKNKQEVNKRKEVLKLKFTCGVSSIFCCTTKK